MGEPSRPSWHWVFVLRSLACDRITPLSPPLSQGPPLPTFLSQHPSLFLSVLVTLDQGQACSSMASSCVCLVIQSCLTLCDPIDRSPGSSVHGVLQARIQVWVAISFSRGSSWPRDQTQVSCVSCIGSCILYCWATREAPWLISIRVMSQPAQYNRANQIWQDRKYDHNLRPSGDGNTLTCTELVKEMALESRIQGLSVL